MSAPIVCEGLSKTFRGVQAVDALNLIVPEGAIFGLCGPNGAGKSTALKAMMNIIAPDRGRALILGLDSRRLGPDAFAKIGYVSENQEMPDWMTVGYLMTYLKPFYPTWDDARALELLRQYELPLDRKIGKLSRGMWMKTALASSLAYRPRLLVLDEPFSGLDPLTRDDLIQGILESAEETTILVSSHDLAEIETFASHIGYLDRGHLRFSEEMASLTARFREIDVFLENGANIPGPPEHWLQFETSPGLARFIDTRYDEQRTAAQIRSLFTGVRDVSATPMPLRSIFLALARNKGRIQ